MHSDGYFDERVAATYDDDVDAFNPEKVEPVVDFLAELADGGNALEFGIGTGRIALPLAMKGIKVHGIELSNTMITKLTEKSGSDRISVIQGDFTTASCGESFSLVYLIFNTIMNLTTQDEQVRCFQNAASHLKPGGSFVLEVMVPALQSLPHGETNRVFDLCERHWGVDTYDVVSQSLTSHHLRIHNQKMELSSIHFRYVWPSELDLMARIANLKLRARWGGWKKEPFTNTSRYHVSVWEKPN
ncbi:class I SAM-dependent methyltransferase [Mastigocoleus testarum]|uniref:Methyltransferase n=1 Tax=Mastigocoleus testarum BC008 TaxID=371196 RepID=A0A0V7ZR67_9CYAN|nr:class I SAM-dependent methyltransferase [Mastigocoleus testarum]KST66373.1 methyltransferase [Mastigocoleus testarum BC008]KST66694.1 methyltransferase [Mastigocoleus testarum BC008]